MNALAAVFEAKKAEFRPKDRLTTVEKALARAQRTAQIGADTAPPADEKAPD